MDNSNNNKIIAASAVAAVSVVTVSSLLWYLRSKGDNAGKTLVGFLDEDFDKEEKKLFMQQNLNQVTFSKLIENISNFYSIEKPRLFLQSNGREILSIAQVSESVVFVIITKNGTLSQPRGNKLLPIPKGPTPIPIFKNIFSLVPNIASSSIRLMQQYGPIFELHFPANRGGGKIIFVADPQIIDEIVSQPKLWAKLHMKNVKVLRDKIGDGLFTSDDDEDIWHSAHRILLPAFSANGMKKYFNLVIDCTNELSEKFETLSETTEFVNINDWSARFTLEVILRVAFGTTFHCFSETPSFLHDLENAFCDNLLPAYRRIFPHPFVDRTINKAWGNINSLLKDIIDKKKIELDNNEEARKNKDLITLMLTAPDPATNQVLPNENIRSQVLTFLVAGHDSTSTAITTLLYYIASNPDVEEKILKELDEVIGDEPLEWNHLGQLKYCYQVIQENLRINPPAPGLRKTATEDTSLGGKYEVKKGEQIMVMLFALHFNPSVWPNPEKFDPERFTEENSKDRNRCAWLPFSIGPRGCIGQQLSLMEQKVFLATVFRRFKFTPHSSCKLVLTFPLFAKPNGVHLVITKRENFNHQPSTKQHKVKEPTSNTTILKDLIATENDKKLKILYGSNMETSFSFAQQLANQGNQYKFQVSLQSLDAALADEFYKKREEFDALIIITSTYNGEPPDNAVAFRSFLQKQQHPVFEGIKYTIYGCGNSQWKTFQAFPNFVDEKLSLLGAQKIFTTGKGDADRSIDDDFLLWSNGMWSELHQVLKLTHSQDDASNLSKFHFYRVEKTEKPAAGANNLLATGFAATNQGFLGKILVNRELYQAAQYEKSTNHIEIAIPPGKNYTTGDHLAVYGKNHRSILDKVAKLLEISLDETVVLFAPNEHVRSILPVETPVRVFDLLESYVELQAPVSISQVSYLLSKAQCPKDTRFLENLVKTHSQISGKAGNQDWEEYVVNDKRTLIELLEDLDSVKLSLGELISILPTLRPRYYSIASSNLVTKDAVHLTVGHVNHLTRTGRRHFGLASNYLANLKAGDEVAVFIKDTKSNFRLPNNNDLPVILVGAGTGFSPLRGFIHERHALGSKGNTILFFGCRDDTDYIYRDEILEYVDNGTLASVEVAFSRKQDSKVYVQHKILAKSDVVNDFISRGAHIYVCGDAKYMAPAVRSAFCDAFKKERGIDQKQAEYYLTELTSTGRYCEDVWAS